MYLKSVDGKILFDGCFSNVKQGLEMAVESGVSLQGINLRSANLAGAQLDNAKMEKACFWGANLNGTNMSDGNFEKADFRTAHFLDTCLAEANCEDANFEGAYFSRTIFTDTNLCKAQFSCPSIFTIDLSHVAGMEGAIYSHLGEVDCDLSHAPLIIRGLSKPMIFMDDCMLIGNDLKKISMRNAVLESILNQTEIHKIVVNQ
jgi:uncharacterized protein YjbI with pentapeptide repeats